MDLPDVELRPCCASLHLLLGLATASDQLFFSLPIYFKGLHHLQLSQGDIFIMDDVIIFLLFLLGVMAMFVGLPFSIIFAILSCSAWGRTRTWRKEKAQHFSKDDVDVEMDGLIAPEEDSEEEPIDSEDEAEINARKEARKTDWELTTHQKFMKELKKGWNGEYQKEAAAKIEREQRARVAKDVAREMIRAQRKRERKAKKTQGKVEEATENILPTYDAATASSS